ncbi:GNAT family N-acetyltransferase [Nocardioides sp. LHG3406-4]|uniref:GNAT family N-acetyltransferase n=1 Tax=Nocardioides sp. LHG3406-4 TaxID=2804575 RepID=UPI003CE83241
MTDMYGPPGLATPALRALGTTDRDDLVLRSLTGVDEVELFNQLPYTLNHELPDDLDAGRRRPDWMWVALRGGRLVARVAWWGRPDESSPLLLDVLDFDPGVEDAAAVAEALLLAAAASVLDPASPTPEYGRYLSAGWRDDPSERAMVESLKGIVERAGATSSNERLRLEWRPETPVPAGDARLAFRDVEGDELLDLMARALAGTLDVRSRADLRDGTPALAARRHHDEELARYTSPREWWRVATLGEGGDPVGFVVPARNAYHAVIAYLGVLPEHRGRGYVDGILAEGTRILAAHDVPRIRAATDVDNTPMAAAFSRAGYVSFERAITMTWD